MIDGLLAAGHRPEVKALAESMKAGQQLEVTAFTELLNKLDASTRLATFWPPGRRCLPVELV